MPIQGGAPSLEVAWMATRLAPREQLPHRSFEGAMNSKNPVSTAEHSDALVFFGATGDLAHKMIFPALQAMVKHGRLDVPDRRRRQVGLRTSSSSARARRRASRSTAVASTAPRSRSCHRSLRYVDGDYRDAADLRAPAQRARLLGSDRSTTSRSRRACSPPWSGLSRRSGCGQGRAGRRREALRARPQVGARAQPRPPRRVRRVGHLPHRPLPRQGARAEPPLLPLRQLVPRADLEPQLRRERADHDGRELRREGPRPPLRGDRRDPRRRPEPHAAGGRLPGDGTPRAAEMPRRCATRRPACWKRSSRSPPTASCAASFVAIARSPASLPTHGSRRSPPFASRSTAGAGPACPSTSASASACPSPPPRCSSSSSRLRARSSARRSLSEIGRAELPALPPRPRRGDRARGALEDARGAHGRARGRAPRRVRGRKTRCSPTNGSSATR